VAFALLLASTSVAGTYIKASRKGAKPIYVKAQVPNVPATVPFFKLANTAAPVEFMNEHLDLLKLPHLKIGPQTHVSQTGETVHAFADAKTGDAHLVPNITRLLSKSETAGALDASRAAQIGLSKFSDVRFIPHDVTQLKLAPGI